MDVNVVQTEPVKQLSLHLFYNGQFYIFINLDGTTYRHESYLKHGHGWAQANVTNLAMAESPK